MTDRLLPEALSKAKGITAKSADTDKHSFIFLYYQEQKLFPALCSFLFFIIFTSLLQEIKACCLNLPWYWVELH